MFPSFGSFCAFSVLHKFGNTTAGLLMAGAYKSRRPVFPFSSGWFPSPPPISQLHSDFCVDRQTYYYISLFNMVQIKLFFGFILASAVIAPVLVLATEASK